MRDHVAAVRANWQSRQDDAPVNFTGKFYTHN
jgi:hypothetical protein